MSAAISQQTRLGHSLLHRLAAKIATHAQGCFDTLIVTGKLKQSAITHALVETLCALVARAHFQRDVKRAADPRAFFEPFEKSTADTETAVAWRHREQIQMRVVVAIAHDREASDALTDAREQHVGVGRADARGDASWRPAPVQSV